MLKDTNKKNTKNLAEIVSNKDLFFLWDCGDSALF